MSDTQNTPWYPPGEGWVEWHGGPNPVPGALVERLWNRERQKQEYIRQPCQSDDVDWSDYVVAYRVVTPASSTIDRALFDEMVEALAFYADPCRYDGTNQSNPGNDKYSTGAYLHDVRRDNGDIARAVLANAREASK